MTRHLGCFCVLAALLLIPAAFGAGPAPVEPSPFIIHRVAYAGDLTAEHADFRAEYEIEVLDPEREVAIGLVGGEVAPSGFQTSSRAARLVRHGDWIHAAIRGRGRFTVSLEFATAVKDEQDVWKRLSFKTPRAVRTEVMVSAEGEDSKVELLAGTAAATEHARGYTRVTGYMGAEPEVALRWQARAREKRVAPVVLCDVHHLAEVSASVLSLDTRLVYEVTQGEASVFEADIEKTLTVVRVAGENVRDWAIVETGDGQRLRVDLLKPATGRYRLDILAEQPVGNLPAALAVPVVRAAGVERQGGTIAVAPSDVAVTVDATRGLSRINPDAFISAGGWTNAGLASKLQSVFRFVQPDHECRLKISLIEPEITARYALSARVAERRVQWKADVQLEVKKAGIFGIVLDVPTGLVVTDVTGADIETWKVEGGALNVRFGRRILGAHRLAVAMEQTYDALPPALTFAGLQGRAMAEQSGTVGISAGPGIVLREDQSRGVRPLAVDALPARAGDESLGFEFRAAEWQVSIRPEALAPRVAAEVFNLITIGDGFLGGSATINYTVEKAGVQELVVEVPGSWQNVDITGLDIRRKGQEEGGAWRVLLQDRLMGPYTLVITYDQPFDPNKDVIEPAGLKTAGTDQESGYVVVTSGSQLEVGEAQGTDGLRRLDAREIPGRYMALVENPVLRTYAYSRQPYALKLKTVRHAEEKPLEAVADRVKLVTVVAKSGRRETQATYLVKNNIKDQLHLTLPEGAELWTAFVDGKAVKPEIHEGSVVIPLKKTENRDLSYPVEIVYVEQGQGLSRIFRRRLALDAPLADLRSSFIEWEVYLPRWIKAGRFDGRMKPDREYVYDFSGDIERVAKVLDAFYLWARGMLVVLAIAAALVWAVVRALQTGRAKTLVEILVVIAILGLLAGLLLPALSSSRMRAQRVSSMSNLRSVGSALMMYSQENKGNLPASLDELVGKYVSSGSMLVDNESGERYDYYGRGKNLKDLPADAPIAVSSSPQGANVLFADGHVEWVTPDNLQQQIMPKVWGLPAAAPAAPAPAALPAIAAGVGEPAAREGEGAVAAGLLPIRIELPKEGRVWRFSKVLDTSAEPLTVRAVTISTARVRNVAFALAALWLLAGLIVAHRATPESAVRSYTAAIILFFFSAWVLFAAADMVFVLLLLVPAAVALFTFSGLLRRPPRARTGPPVMPGSGDRPASAGIVLLLLAGLSLAPGARAEDVQQAPAPPPPLRAQVVRAEYSGIVTGAVAAFDGVLAISASAPLDEAGLPAGDFSHCVVPLLGGGAVVRDAQVVGKGARIIPWGDGNAVFIPHPGEYSVRLSFVARVTGDASRKEIAFVLPPSVTCVVECSIDEREATVSSSGAVTVKKHFDGDRTRAEVFVGKAPQFELAWIPRVKRAGEVRVSAVCRNSTLVSIEEGAIRLFTALRYDVSQGELLTGRIHLADGLRLLKVSGDNVLNWELMPVAGGQELVVEMKSAAGPDDVLLIESELGLPALPASVPIRAPRALDMQRELGVLAFSAEPEMEFTPGAQAGLQQIDPGDFPMAVLAAAAVPKDRPPTLAYQYRADEFALNVDVSRMTPELKVVVNELLRVEEQAVVLEAGLDYDIRKAGVFELSVAIPEGYDIESVTGPAVKQWFDEQAGGRRVLRVVLNSKTRGACAVHLALRQRRDAFAEEVSVPEVVPLEVAEAKGFVAVGTAFGITLVSQEAAKLAEIPVGELPGRREGAVLAFKFREPGWSLSVKSALSQPWVQAEGMHVIRLSEGFLRARSDFRFTIQNAPVDRFAVSLPEKAENVRVEGVNIRQRDQEGTIRNVVLQSKVRGTYDLSVQFDLRLPAGTTEVAVPFAQSEGTEREQGIVVVCSIPTLHVAETGRTEQILLPVDTRDLPPAARNAGGDDIRAAYRYLRRGQELVLSLRRYQAAEVLQANIESARLTSVLGDDGQMMTQASLSMRNNAKQNLEIMLPAGAEVWSCFVAGEAVRVAVKDGVMLLPLVQTGDEEPAFDIELTYVHRERPLGRGRSIRLVGPQPDVPMHKIRWDMYLPDGYHYSLFGGSATRRDDVKPMFREFALGEYQSQIADRIASEKAEAAKLAADAKVMATRGDVAGARRQLKRAQQIAQDEDISQGFKEVEKAEAIANVASQQGKSYQEAVQMGVQWARPGAGGAARQTQAQLEISDQVQQAIAVPDVRIDDKAVIVAEEQARKIRKTQAVTVSKVTPLRISVPVRGLQHVFEQVLWVPKDDPVTVTMRARPAYGKSFFKLALSGIAGCLFLGVFVSGWTRRNRGRVLLGAVLLAIAYGCLIYL